MVPKTKDGRLIFAIPWLGKVVIGTTDLPAAEPKVEPGFDDSEIDYLIETINPFLSRPIAKEDILSIFSGLRPLISEKAATTAKISARTPDRHLAKWAYHRGRRQVDNLSAHGRRHSRLCDQQRPAAEGAVCDEGVEVARSAYEAVDADSLSRYGTDAVHVRDLISADASLATKLDDELPFTQAEVIFAVRQEMARTVEDVLSRRTRALLLNARAAERAAPVTAQIMADELGRDKAWADEQVASLLRTGKELLHAPVRLRDRIAVH